MYFCTHFIILMFFVGFIQCFSSIDEEEETLTTQSSFVDIIEKLKKEDILLTEGWRQLKIDKKKLNEAKKLLRSNKSEDVIRLNIGGELLMTTRHTLTKVPNSIFAMLFNGRWEHKLGNDIDGNMFLDFNPIVFRHLLEQLQTLENVISPTFNPPLSSSLVIPFEKMLRKLGFTLASSSSNEIIAFNVGGEQMITRQNTLTQISQSKLADIVVSSKVNNKDINGNVFIDHDPKLFRHLIQQLREQRQKDNQCFHAPSHETKDSFNRMLQSFSLNPATASSSSIYNDSTINGVKSNDGRCFIDYPEDCAAVYFNAKLLNQNVSNGIYKIWPKEGKSFTVYCDMETDGGGWTLFQKRDDLNPQEDFYRTWLEYERGFGDVPKQFWLGNDRLSILTNQNLYQLRVDLEDFDGQKRFAQYDSFRVANGLDKYRLTIGSYKGDAGDSMSGHNNSQFSTKDQDNDQYPHSCAQSFTGAWWYHACHDSNLNGRYLRGDHPTVYAQGINWHPFKGHRYSLKRTEMKIRPVSFKSSIF